MTTSKVKPESSKVDAMINVANKIKQVNHGGISNATNAFVLAMAREKERERLEAESREAASH